ncbi:hypothetical protein NLG97_g9142 [Lecanicillium saksenae]|uniref:Uncharacterized protein n=1 Tax=Lecanicillium saksenae TaxID=468837 RepID=A0ACC1QJB6_9HYPO|nr:hypothetical protein NLG97_g9142 [Lecanicillium saksenae]
MKTREIVRVETIYFAPDRPKFRAVSCLLIVAVRGLPLQFYSETTAAAYNLRGETVWSRCVKLYKSIPRDWRERNIEDAASSTSTSSREVIGHSPEEHPRLFPHQYRVPSEYYPRFAPTVSPEILGYTRRRPPLSLPHRHTDRTPVAQYHHHHPLPYHLHRPQPQYQVQQHYDSHSQHHSYAPHRAYIARGQAVHVFSTSNTPQSLVQIDRSSSSGHWYTSFDPQQRRWVNNWQRD